MDGIRIRFQYLIIIACIVMIYAGFECVTSKNNRNFENELSKLIEKYEKRIGYDMEEIYNYSKSHLLLKPLLKKGVENTKEKVNRFFVIRISDNALILEEEILNGSMDWINDSEIKIFYPSGVPGQERTMIYNVNSKSKKSKDY